jgi:DNA invertase Pin-like site-specific DNA recombinase
MISIRTKEGLARAKARGVKLGGANAQSQRNRVMALERANALLPILRDIVGDRTDMSATRIAIELNNRRVPAATKGSKWHAMQVIRVMQRLGMKGPELVLAVQPD